MVGRVCCETNGEMEFHTGMFVTGVPLRTTHVGGKGREAEGRQDVMWAQHQPQTALCGALG